MAKMWNAAFIIAYVLVGWSFMLLIHEMLNKYSPKDIDLVPEEDVLLVILWPFWITFAFACYLALSVKEIYNDIKERRRDK